MSVTRLQEPAWLRDKRAQAQHAFDRSDLPYWDRTEIRPFDPQAFGSAVAPAYTLPTPPRDVTLCTLAEAPEDLGKPHLGSLLPAARGRFEALHLASLRDAVLLHVPAGVEIEEPIPISCNVTGEGALCAPHMLIVLDEAASASVVLRSEGGDGAMLLPSVEAVLADGARLRFADLQSYAPSAINYSARRGRLGRDASLEWIIGELGCRVVRAYTESVLHSVGGESRSLLAFFGSGRQHMDLALSMVHHGARTSANMLSKGVLKDHARAVYRGTSDIKAGSKDSNSQQAARTLHLGDGVRSDAIPALFIDEYQLSAGHAATVGKVDDEQLFYMRSRGLPEVEALRLVVQGFFAPLLDRIPLPAAREHLRRLIDAKLASRG